MRLIAGIAIVGVAGCAAAPRTPNAPVASCTDTECFYQRDVKGVESIDGSTAVFYVGPQRCPFVVHFDGIRCGATLGPHIALIQGGALGRATGGLPGRICRGAPDLYLYSGILAPPAGMLDPLSRRSPLSGIDNGDVPDPFDPLSSVDACRVLDIRSINDDQLVEMRVNAGIAPPPPPMRGRIEVPDKPAASAPAPARPSDPAQVPAQVPAPAEPSTPAPAPAE